MPDDLFLGIDLGTQGLRAALFAADAAANMFGRLDLSIVYEDLEEGRRSLTKLSALDFEVACFGHCKAIVGGAAERFRRKWRPTVARPSGAA